MANPFNPRDVVVGYVEETVFNETPSSPTLQLIPFVSWDMKQVTETTTSRIIRSSRATPELIRNGVSSEITIASEFLATAYDPFMEAMLMSADYTTEVTVPAGVTDIAAVNGTSSFDRSSGSWISDGYLDNQWIYVSGFSAAGANGFFKITDASSATVLTVDPAPAEDPSGDTVTFRQASTLTDGNEFRSFLFEEDAGAASENYFKQSRGVAFNTWSMTVDVDQPLTCEFGCLGAKLVAPIPTSTVAGGTTPASTNKVFSSVTDVISLFEGIGGTTPTQEILGFDWSLTNNMAIRKLVGTLGAAKPHFFDEFGGTGNMRMYVAGDDTRTILDKYLNHDESDLAAGIKDAAGNGYVFEFPAVKFTDMDDPTEGGSDRIVSLPFTITDHSTEGVAMRISRFTSLA